MNTSATLTPQQAIAALLERYAPQQLLYVANSSFPALEAYLSRQPNCQLSQQASSALRPELAARRYDLAIIADCLEHMPKASGLQLLAGIRNLNASRIAVLIDLERSDWNITDFYALALQNSGQFQREGQQLTLFTYDLLEYKQVPDWLNAKFWANPQNFGKYWW